MSSQFIISLDVELYWGLRDKCCPEQFEEKAKEVPRIIDKLLLLFERYNVKATFAIVGFLLGSSRAEILDNAPTIRPNYLDSSLNPYLFLQMNTDIDKSPHLYFAPSLIRRILDAKVHEIASHTYSHYYCLEPGSTLDAFRADLTSMNTICSSNGFKVSSIVFPRNQFSHEHLTICEKNEYICYRGNRDSWLYRGGTKKNEYFHRRVGRLIDSYARVTQSDKQPNMRGLYNMPASTFLRSYVNFLSPLESLRLRRIKREMLHAARFGESYHLWWHPHNFFPNTTENLAFLEKVLDYYSELQVKYSFRSVTMKQAVENRDQKSMSEHSV